MIGTLVWRNGYRDQKKGSSCSYRLWNRQSPVSQITQGISTETCWYARVNLPLVDAICVLFLFSWGTAAHVVFLVFCLMTNIIVTAMLLLGGSAVVNALTGVNIYAASFLIPLGVIVYTLAGGLKATFLASYIHSVIGVFYKNILSNLLLTQFSFFPCISFSFSISFFRYHDASL